MTMPLRQNNKPFKLGMCRSRTIILLKNPKGKNGNLYLRPCWMLSLLSIDDHSLSKSAGRSSGNMDDTMICSSVINEQDCGDNLLMIPNFSNKISNDSCKSVGNFLKICGILLTDKTPSFAQV